MEFPFGFKSDDESSNRGYVLKLNKIFYGLKHASTNGFSCLKKGLEDRDFEQSDIDPCVFYRKDDIIVCYVDNCIIISK